MDSTMKKILVIEDNEAVRENLEEILTLADYEVATAPNGKIGVEAAMQTPPDIILCDVMMPELDGFGVLHILSRTPSTADIPFIFLTAKSDQEDFRKGMDLGADDYLTKPFNNLQLLSTIERRLKKRESIEKKLAPKQVVRDFYSMDSLAMKALQQLLENRELRHFKKKDILFQEGDYPRWLYYIHSGKIKLVKTNEDGKEFITQICGKGDFLGYLCILKESDYIESAILLEDSEVYMIPRSAFTSLVFSNTEVAVKFVKMLAKRVSDQEELLVDLAYNSVRKRVANILLYLAKFGGNEIQLLREDLASMAGTAKETVIRTLSDFKQERLIDLKDHSIIILNFEKLMAMPN